MTSQQIKRISLRSLQGPLKYWYLIVLSDIYDVRRWYALDFFMFMRVFFFFRSLLPLTWLRFFCACVTIFVRSEFPEPEEEVQREKNDKNRSLPCELLSHFGESVNNLSNLSFLWHILDISSTFSGASLRNYTSTGERNDSWSLDPDIKSISVIIKSVSRILTERKF